MLSRRLLCPLIKCCPPLQRQQQRNTWILKRVNKPYLKKSWVNPLVVGPALKRINADYELHPDKDFLYEVVKNTENDKMDDIEVLLLKHVKGLGVAGDIVKVRPGIFRHHLYLKREATYASPENLELYKDLIENKQRDINAPSSALSPITVEKLSKTYAVLELSSTQPWTVEPWHVRIALRNEGFIVPEYAIKMPETPITGPDVEGKQDKDFAVFITINKNEQVAVRCTIHHIGAFVHDNWKTRAVRVPILAEQKELLESMFSYPVEEEEEE
ncbi:hypothetical protein B4U79_00967 [Dinothrombium tinctorium]|uniref:Large ribosomal subunit protein bL9m n=1 Tax=Dinothrombium tinctorium TaxID=1965070 RepID=A0A443R1N8_9ACAR|nr:hypothetical protein B4U79_00967 [Dinothrombium tinctorium]